MGLNDWIAVVALIATIIIAVITFWLNKVYRSRDSIKRFPPLNKKWSKPFFRLASEDEKSISRFVGFFDKVEMEVVELDLVVDDGGLIVVSRDKMENENILASDYLTIWQPYKELGNDVAGPSNSTGFCIRLVYNNDSDAGLYYQHGCWYLRGFFTVLPGFTNNGICEISLRVESVQPRNR